MSDDPKDPFPESWLAAVEARRGQTVAPPSISYLFSFYEAAEAVELVRNWHREIGLDHFYPIGHFCSGDFVCAHPSGVLFVVMHDDFEWWDSDVSFGEFIERLDAEDITVEEDVYSRDRTA